MACVPEGTVLLKAQTAADVRGQPQPAARSTRGLFRFSVRGLLVLILVVGCGLGWLARVVRTGDAQRRAVAAIYQAGGWVVYDTAWDGGQNPSTWKPRWPRWLVDRLGVDYFGNVVFINLHDRGTDAVLAQVARFHHLKQLHRPGFAVTDAGLARLGRLSDLQLLSLDGTQVTDAGLAHLKGLSGLKWLKLSRTRVTDTAVTELQKSLPHLQAIR
jgi:internalin A